MPAVTRRQYAGAAVATTTVGNLAAGGTSVSITAATGWPSTAGVGFFVVISPGTSIEEKCLATISGTTLTLTRAQDGTTAQTHPAGSTIYPVFSRQDADDANRFLSTLTTRGDLLTMGSGPDPARIAVGSANTVLKSNGTDPSWGLVVTANITDSNVTTAKIADANVTTAKITDSNVTTAKLADSAVTSAKLGNMTVDTKTADYTLVAGDRNKRIVMNSATAKAITVNTSVFAAGDVVWIHNINTGTCTITAGTATVTTASSLALAQWEGGFLYFTSTGAAIFFRGGRRDTLSVEYLLVGGGGGGGGGTNLAESGGGGGGAGGFITGTGIIGRTTYTVTVGAGGAAGTVNSPGKTGTASSFIRAANGGGGGGSHNGSENGTNGASGGGASSGTSTAGTGISGEGNNGGSNGTNAGGGGGGAGGVGSNGSSATGGAGGTASTNNYDGTSRSYAGGGGGGGGTTGGAAGTNAGAGGGSDTAGSAATANFGGGGGGGGDNTNGGNGGSGVVIVRWLTANATGLSISVTGTTTTGTDGSYTWYKWTSTGTLVVA